MIAAYKYMGGGNIYQLIMNKFSANFPDFFFVARSPRIAPTEEIQGKQTKTNLMAEPDNSVKDDRILTQAGDCRNLQVPHRFY